MSEENKPVEPEQNGQPTDAVQPAKTAESASASEPVQSAEAVKSAEAATEPVPAEAAKPAAAESEQPAKAAKSVEAAPKSAEATEPAAKPERPARPERPAKEPVEEAPAVPSPNQPLLDHLVRILSSEVAENAVTASSINEANDHLPTVVISPEHWADAASVMRDHPDLKCNYLRNMSGVDQETHLEVVYHLISLSTRINYCVRVITDREVPSIPTVSMLWEGANWNEREIFDLLGIDFPGHPNMTRIMLADDWVGHPLRKDYEPLDPEV
jgi:NADH-quinone oxidoreductase subunit C